MNVIGDIPEHVAPGSSIDAIEVGALVVNATAEARAVIHASDD